MAKPLLDSAVPGDRIGFQDGWRHTLRPVGELVAMPSPSWLGRADFNVDFHIQDPLASGEAPNAS
ncbi:MAG: hypothetical protein OXI81_11990 [Paracoccaceae bacterium]|nr:hypothetical protein [Paracoccaceae bacterium]MDE2912639.1 hypothetical protein [Paracoccaceae bacterium]